MMYLSAMEFLEEEREAWRPFEALDTLSDEDLVRPVPAAHGWSGRDLMVHIAAWVEQALAVARELAVGETSASLDRLDAEWAAGGDAMNARIANQWAAMTLTDVRARFRAAPGELRGTLTVIPEARWVKHPRHLQSFIDETTDHYADHAADLAAILAAAR